MGGDRMKEALRKNCLAFLAYFTITLFVFYSYVSAKPNIIFILADDLGYGDVGCYGQQQIKTPNIDSLAKQGVRYTSCYAGCAVSAPSRCCLMTGMHTGHAFIRGNLETGAEGQQPIAASEITVAEILKSAGYTTGLIGKWGLGMNNTEGDPARHGFDYYCSVLCQRQAHNHFTSNIYENGVLVSPRPTVWQDDLFKDKALQFLTNNKDRPFFLYLAYCSPHANVEVPDTTPYTTTSWTPVEKCFAAMVTRLDSNVGAVVAHIRQLGLDTNTIIFFASDNGPHSEGGHSSTYFNSNGNLRGMKRDVWDGGIRVPMIARWTGKIQPGRVSDFVWAFWDFLPTAAELAGTKAPRGLDGISVLPDILGNAQTPHTYFYWEFSEGTPKQAIRKDSLKAVRIWPTVQPAIYNIVRDTAEATDLAGSYSAAYIDTVKRIMNIVRFPSGVFPRTEMDTITTLDLVARYSFDNSGTDSAFCLFPMTFEGTPYFTLGRSGTNGLYVDGKSGFGIVQRNVANNLTVSYWLKTPSIGGSAWASATGMVDGYIAAADSSFGAGLTSGKVAVAIEAQVISSAALVNNGQWHHIAVTRNGTNGQVLIYIDGAQSGSGTGPVGWLTESKALTVGCLSTDNGICTGAFDNLRFYNYVLASSAILALTTETQPSTSIPGARTRIQAESYSFMSGVQLEATADADSGLQIGSLSSGSWAEYRANVTTAGAYTLYLRILNTGAAASFNILSNSIVVGTIAVPTQAAWQTISVPVTLSAGLQTIRLSATAGTAMKLNWLDIERSTDVTITSNSGINHGNASIEFISGRLLYSVKQSGNVTISIFNAAGRLLAQWHPAGTAGTVNRTEHPLLSSLPDGLNILTLDQEGKRIALKRLAVIR